MSEVDELDEATQRAADALVNAHCEGLNMYSLCEAFMAAMARVAPNHNVSLDVTLRRRSREKSPKARKTKR